MPLHDTMKSLRNCSLALCAAVLIDVPAASNADTPASEYAVKAAIVYKIAKFVSWPQSGAVKDGNVLSICLAANDPITPSIEALSGEQIHGRDIVVRRLTSAEAAIDDCEIVYLSRPTAEKHGALLDRLAEAPVLTIGDSGSFTKSGGIIALEIRQSRIRFAINVRASQRAGLDISAQLLQLANIED